MTFYDFEKLEYFTFDEKDYKGRHIWHDFEVLNNTDFESMKALDNIRGHVGVPCVLHCAYEDSGHSSKSLHYSKKGTAIDFHFDSCDYLRTINTVLEAINIYGYKHICGLGIYPDWYNPGFHFDLRGDMARWGALTEKGRQKYFDFEYVLSYVVENNL